MITPPSFLTHSLSPSTSQTNQEMSKYITYDYELLAEQLIELELHSPFQTGITSIQEVQRRLTCAYKALENAQRCCPEQLLKLPPPPDDLHLKTERENLSNERLIDKFQFFIERFNDKMNTLGYLPPFSKVAMNMKRDAKELYAYLVNFAALYPELSLTLPTPEYW